MTGNNGSPQFVDTNVLVYAHDVSAGKKHGRAKELIEELWKTGSGCLSVQVLQEFYVTVTQKVPEPLISLISCTLKEGKLLPDNFYIIAADLRICREDR